MSAAKDNTTTISQDTSKEINQEKIGIDDSSLNKEILKTNNENTTLKEPVSGGTFNDIQTAINNASSGSIIELSGLYIGNGTQITIDKKLTIIGKDDATLDAKGKSKIFYLNANEITLKNIKFINGNSDTGGAISAHSFIFSNCISNCTFINNTARDGGAIGGFGRASIIKNCTFINNTANMDGGAISIDANSDIEINNSTFTNNNAKYNGGAIYIYGTPDSTINECYFTKNTANNNGGAIYWKSGENCKIKQCTFIKNTGNNGGAINLENPANTTQILNSNFKDNKAKKFKNINTNKEDLTLSGCSLETVVNIDSLSDCIIGSSAIVNLIFDDGTNIGGYNVILKNNNQTIKTFEYNSNHRYTYTWNNLAVGEYSITVNESNENNNKYITSYEPVHFTVYKKAINPNDINVMINPGKGNVTININAPTDLTNTINIIIDEKNYTIAVTEGTGTKTITLTPGKHNLTGINITNNPIYNNTFILKTDGNFTVNKIDINPNDINVMINPAKGNVTINITTPKNFTGIMNVIIDEKSYNIPIFEGTGTKTITLTPGKHNLTGINITNNPIYEDIFILKTDGNFTVNKIDINPNDINIKINPGKGNATININAPTDLTNTINIIIDGKNYTIAVTEGTGTKTIILTPGKHNLTGINITNDPIYEDVFILKTDGNFTVNKIDINPNDINIKINPGKGNATININVPTDLTNTINIIIDGKNYTIAVTEGTGTKTIILTPGKHNLTGINITNDPIYEDIFILKTDGNFTVNKIDINPNDINIKINPGKGNATININVPTDLTNTINIIIDGKNYTIAVTEGTGTKTIILTPGKHNLTGINITNDPIYEDAFILKTNENFTVNKIDIGPGDVNITVTPDKGNATINIKAPTEFTGNIIIIIDNVSYPVELVNGVGFKIIILPSGYHNITGVNITNNTIYNDTFIPENIPFVVLKKDTIITAEDISFIINYGGRYTVSTNLGSGKTITLIINNKNINAITDANGVATFKLTKANLAPAGVKTATIIFNGDDNYTSYTANTKITVNKETTKITGKSAKKTYKKTANKKLKITLKDSTGKSLGKVKIHLKAKKLKGKLGKKLKKGYYITVKFNKKGIGYITLKNKKVNGFKKGTYKFTVTYKGNNIYKPSKSKIKMKIK